MSVLPESAPDLPRFHDDDDDRPAQDQSRPALDQSKPTDRPRALDQTAIKGRALDLVRSRPLVSWNEAGRPSSLLIEEATVVGTAPGVGLRLGDATVSRLHAEFFPGDDGLWVRDLGSRNGTFVDRIRVTEARVPESSVVTVGSTEFRVTYDSEPVVVPLWPDSRFGPLVGSSLKMRELFASLARVAPFDASVAIYGETGTGKELVARAIHDASKRASKPFVVVDCAALPENLLEAELFGHARGAFTGAVSARPGSLEYAEGGTVFLDEIGELPLSVQPKLLRALESRTIRRLGENNYRQIDVRFVSATHRNLSRMVSEGSFREDLYFRLSVIPVNVPALRERPDDIEMLVNHFLAVHDEPGASEALLTSLMSRRWPGNVRELRNFVERARALGPEHALKLVDGSSVDSGRSSIPAAVASQKTVARQATDDEPASTTTSFDEAVFSQLYRDFREAWIEHGEREYVRRLLERHGRNVALAAKAAGVNRTYVYRLVRRYGL